MHGQQNVKKKTTEKMSLNKHVQKDAGHFWPKAFFPYSSNPKGKGNWNVKLNTHLHAQYRG